MQVPTLAEEATSPGRDEPSAQKQTQPAGPPQQTSPKADGPKVAPKPAEESAQKRGEENPPKSRLVSILGREITNREGDSGRVIDVLVDLDGRSGAVVVEFGGFMGIGSRKVVVDWSAVHLVREGNRTAVVVDISREEIRGAAEFKPGEPVSVLGIK
jgi:hypothetical protein